VTMKLSLDCRLLSATDEKDMTMIFTLASISICSALQCLFPKAFLSILIASHLSKREDLHVGELSLPPGVNLANDLSTATHPSAVAQDEQSLRSLESGNKETCQYNSH
jgi:hypothetical protein